MKIELVDLCELIVGAGISGPANAQSIDELIFLNNQRVPTNEELQNKKNELIFQEFRRQRNEILASTDWRMVSDYPGSNQTEWQTYRQALRDITTQTPSLDSDGNLTGITWPIPPNN